jgi:tetratricopeptide (TPR) repeat protein
MLNLKRNIIYLFTILCIFIFSFAVSIYKFNYYPLSTTIYIDKLPYKNFSSRDYREVGEKLFLQKHNLKAAKIHLNKSIELKPDNEKALFLLGRIAFVQSDLPAAIDYFNQVIELDPLSTEGYYGLGLSYGYMSDYRRAEESFLRFFDIIEINKKIDPEYKDAYGLWAAYNDLAWIYFLEGKYDKAEKVTDEALSKYSNAWLYTMKGAILLNKNQDKEAKKYLDLAEQYASEMTVEQFGEAYTGDNKDWHERGLAKMKQTIKDNQDKINTVNK